jgi:Ribbon-helix-helix protein, copG family
LGTARPRLQQRCIIYIMRRTQLYLDDQLWKTLHERARSTGTTISELVRTAARERYLGNLQERRAAMQALVGLRKDRHGFNDSESYVRRLRRGARIEKMARA